MGTILFSILFGAGGLFLFQRAGVLFVKISGAAIILLAVISFGLASISLYSNRTHSEDTLWGISLGTPAEEVKFLKGTPAEQVGPDEWHYIEHESDSVTSQYVIGFREGKVAYISYATNGGSGPSMQGISVGTIDQTAVQERFGDPASVQRSSDDLSKILSYPKYSLWVGLTLNRVDSLGVYDPKVWHPSFAANLTGNLFPDRLRLERTAPNKPASASPAKVDSGKATSGAPTSSTSPSPVAAR